MINIAIDSVINQSYKNWELIVVNDGSIDNTEEVVKNYQLKDNRIKYYFQQNKGRSAARNLGIEYSSGEYVSFLDDDDYYLEDFLSEFENKLRNMNLPVCVVLCRQIEKENSILYKYDKDRNKYLASLIKMYLRYPNVQSLCTSKKIFEKIKFDERFSIGEDLHLFLRIFMNFPSYYIDKYLCVNVFHDQGTMFNEFKKGNIQKYNRLDVFDDLFQNYTNSLKQKEVYSILINMNNKIAYFYESSILKSCKKRKHYLNRFIFKLPYTNPIFFYYIISIIIRYPYYKIKCFINNG